MLVGQLTQIVRYVVGQSFQIGSHVYWSVSQSILMDIIGWYVGWSVDLNR